DRARAGDGITVMGVRSLYPWVPEPLRGRMPRPSEYVCDGCISRPLVLGWWAQEEEMMLARRSVFWLSGKLLRVIDRDRDLLGIVDREPDGEPEVVHAIG